MNLITREDIQEGKPFILKWNNDVVNTGSYNPAWKNPGQADQFFVEMDNFFWVTKYF